jgi:hypothetical protein
MRCGEIKRLITRAARGHLAPEERRRLEAHLAGCPSCYERYFAAVEREVAAPEPKRRAKEPAAGRVPSSWFGTGTWLTWPRWRVPVAVGAGILLGLVLRPAWVSPVEAKTRQSESAVAVSAGGKIAVAIKTPNGKYETRFPLTPLERQQARAAWTALATPGTPEQARESAFFGGARLKALILLDLPSSPFVRSDLPDRAYLASHIRGAERIRDDLYRRGFARVDFQGTMPRSIEALTPYHVVVLIGINRSYDAVAAPLLERYAALGGGVVMEGGIPSYLVHHWAPNDDAFVHDWEHVSLPTNLADIASWFGAPEYVNNDNAGVLDEIDNPFGLEVDLRVEVPTQGAAGVRRRGVEGRSDCRIIAGWTNTDSDVMAFCHWYKRGRIYYQAQRDDRRFGTQDQSDLWNVFVTGIQWAAGAFDLPDGPRPESGYHDVYPWSSR